VLRQGSVTLRMGPYGDFFYFAVQNINLKAPKRFSVGGGRNLELNAQLFNLFNSSGITGVNYQTGTQFGQVTGIVSGRVARIGASFTF
jgi:hypothetical protein